MDRGKRWATLSLLLLISAATGSQAAEEPAGLTTTDPWHFDSESLRLLGERYAEAMQRLRSPGQ